MCGITGLIGSNANYNKQFLPNMIERIAHRGPDGNGSWYSKEKNVALGHTRLAILDTSKDGLQPMHLKTHDLHLIVNGEIYNYPELRKKLENLYGIKCHSNCDSEIILHGYAHVGESFFKLMNGMFAFVLVDGKKNIVHLVRDRIGIKPLYYCKKNFKIAFSSEIKSLVAGFNVNEWSIDKKALSEYLCYQTPMNGRTLFDGIQILKPGHHMIIDLKKVSILQDRPYWSSNLNENKNSFTVALEKVSKCFKSSVKRHLLSDVPISTTLSSGFDSAIVTAQVAELTNKSIDIYTGSFHQEGGWYDETDAANDLTNQINGKHNIVNISADDFITYFDDMIYALDEPRMGIGAFPQYMVARQASKDYKVILHGHGGDELFSGYPIFKFTNKKGWMNLKMNEFPHLAYFIISKIRSFLSPEYGRFMPVLWNTKAREKLFGRSYEFEPWNYLEYIQKKEALTINQIFQTYLNVYLPNLLIVEDKVSMAHSIESRTPLLDNDMISLSLSISQTVKLNEGTLKALIKAKAKRLLPKSFFNQPKRGFPTPFSQWARGPLSETISKRLVSKYTPLNRIFDQHNLQKWVIGYQRSWKQNLRPLDEIQSHQLWQLLSLDSWMRSWENRNGILLK